MKFLDENRVLSGLKFVFRPKMLTELAATTYVKKEPKIIKYRNYEKFSHQDFLAEVNNSLQASITESYDEFEEIVIKILD